MDHSIFRQTLAHTIRQHGDECEEATEHALLALSSAKVEQWDSATHHLGQACLTAYNLTGEDKVWRPLLRQAAALTDPRP